jgi:putative transposase
LDELDLALLGVVDAQHSRRPVYGSGRLVVYWREQGHAASRKRVQRLMRVLGLSGMAPGPNTSGLHPEHRIYPYLLRGVLAWRLSNTLVVGFCVDCLEDTLRARGSPALCNSDQGSPFTSEAFTGVLLREGIAVSTGGRGRALDNNFVERLCRASNTKTSTARAMPACPSRARADRAFRLLQQGAPAPVLG